LDEVLQTDTEMHNFLRHGIEGQKLSKRNIYGLIRNALGGLSPCAVPYILSKLFLRATWSFGSQIVCLYFQPF